MRRLQWLPGLAVAFALTACGPIPGLEIRDLSPELDEDGEEYWLVDEEDVIVEEGGLGYQTPPQREAPPEGGEPERPPRPPSYDSKPNWDGPKVGAEDSAPYHPAEDEKARFERAIIAITCDIKQGTERDPKTHLEANQLTQERFNAMKQRYLNDMPALVSLKDKFFATCP